MISARNAETIERSDHPLNERKENLASRVFHTSVNVQMDVTFDRWNCVVTKIALTAVK